MTDTEKDNARLARENTTLWQEVQTLRAENHENKRKKIEQPLVEAIGEEKTWFFFAEVDENGPTLQVAVYSAFNPSGEPAVVLGSVRTTSKERALRHFLQNPPSLLPLYHWLK